MNETVNQRIRRLRKDLKLTQNEFSAIISISSGQLACIETEKRAVNNRTVKLISDSFNVSAEWLRTGEGPMYSADSNGHTKLLALFNTMKPKYQDYILNSINWFIRIQENE